MTNQKNMCAYHPEACPTLNSSLSKYKSFLGRDYKTMVQNMPATLKIPHSASVVNGLRMQSLTPLMFSPH